ncbi:MAG TPA: filamentous hemagglutinin N-terminal domain-containing protein, partial [Stellaceae bacterium]|nr:filamentous hemagglutinin N-terminal domain-containing protein [Stellaceae bacterium]
MNLRCGAFSGWPALLAALVPVTAAAQHITIDGSLSPARTLAGPNYAIGANLGKTVGANLFHSFGKFGLSSGESATFSGPATIGNVIGRVTGGSRSSIDGKIRSTIAGANLYLINPNGVVFGPKATVNVSGSFYATSANYLKMADGARFQATAPGGSRLSSAPPAAFGFLNARPAAITVNGSALGPVAGTLGLVGGPVTIKGGKLGAPAGTIRIASAAGAGEVPVDPKNTAGLTVRQFGNARIGGGARLDVSNRGTTGPGGNVYIRAGALTIRASEIDADNSGSGKGGEIALRGDRRIALRGGADVHGFAAGSGNGASVDLATAPDGSIVADAGTVLTGSTGRGAGGRFALTTGRLRLSGGADLGSLASGAGSAGSVAVTSRSIRLDGRDDKTDATEIGSTTTGRGRAGDVAVKARALSILGNGEINSITFGPGDAGSVAVDVARALAVDAAGSNLLTGISTQSNDI